MKKILVAISHSFPYGAAYAARTRALCKLFHAAGYETDILCDYISGEKDITEYGKVYSIANKQTSGIKSLVFTPIVYSRKLDYLLRTNKYDLVMTRSMFDRFDLVLAATRKHQIPLILESCEWYDVRGFRHGKWDIRYYQFQHCFKNTYNKADGVIAISRLLEKHYKEQGIPVIRIPGIHDVKKLSYRVEPRDDNKLELIFGGNVFGGKEQFSELLIALSVLNVNKEKIYLHVYGPSREEVVTSLDDDGKCAYAKVKEMVLFHGCVPQSEMAKVCEKSDFGVFFRPDRRSSHAGFPTKLGEYLSAGTPIITNDTGDIALVLKNGKNAFLIEECSAESIRNVLEKCTLMSVPEYREMRKCARDTAIQQLHYEVFKTEMERFLEGIIRRDKSVKYDR